MNISSILGSPLLGLVTMAFPAAAPFVAILQRAAPYVEAAAPIIKAAISEGRPAFEAASAAAPELKHAITDLLSHMPHLAEAAATPEIVMENITRGLVGFHAMTPEEERKWMDDTTSFLNNSQSGSA